jgi:tetratricopeptide (TPR) repeat protein
MAFAPAKKICLRTDQLVCFGLILVFLAKPGRAQTFAELNLKGAEAHAAGRYADAESLFRNALAEPTAASDEQRAVMWSNLAAAYKRQDRYEQAESAFEQAVALRLRAHGPDHEVYALALNSLAEIRRLLGWPDAARLFERALRALPGTAVPGDRAVLLNNLGTIRLEQRRFREALALLEQALRLKESIFSANHPQIAVTLNNLASAQHELHKYAEAEALHLRALAIWEVDRSSASDASLTLTNLGRLYASMKRWSEAETMHRRALSTLDHAGLGESRLAAGVRHNLAQLHARRRDTTAPIERTTIDVLEFRKAR